MATEQLSKTNVQICSHITNNNSAVTGRVSDITYLHEYIDTATRFYVVTCAIFHLKCRNINAYILISYGFRNSLAVT